MTRNQQKLFIIVVAGLSLIGLLAVCCVLINSKPLHLNKAEPKFHAAYPNDREFFETAYKFSGKDFELSGKNVVAGIIPHHLLAADLIANFFRNLEGQDYDAVILIGPNHFLLGQSDIITSAYDWQTPYGVLGQDGSILKELLDIGKIRVEEDVMQGEHSINSEVAFIKKTFPNATFLPIILKPNVDEQTATDLAEALFKIYQNKKVLVLASVDFSHYKTSQEAQQDDKASIAAITGFDFSNIYHLAIDSPASIYTLLKFSQLSKAKFNFLANSNSAILSGKPDLSSTTSYVTGFFVREENIELSRIQMLFVGDIMLDRGIKEIINKKGLNYILDDLKKVNFFDGYDLISGNLEGAVTNGGRYYKPVKDFDFAFNPKTVFELTKYGFNFFNVANNHFDDQGEQGMEETENNLSNFGFDFSGCKNGVVSDCSATVVTIKDKKIGLVGLSMIGTRLDLEKVKKVIGLLKTKTDWVIVNIHWGEEYDIYFDMIQQDVAHKLIDDGADAVVGHHPHVVQGVEVYKGKPIFYSLGNFIFDQYFSDETQKGLAVSLELSDNGINYALHPFRTTNGKINLLIDTERDNFLAEVAKRSSRQ